jgi:lipopolysaccharide/colanic/teichoic acid biosynthesis glycosyltransferase
VVLSISSPKPQSSPAVVFPTANFIAVGAEDFGLSSSSASSVALPVNTLRRSAQRALPPQGLDPSLTPKLKGVYTIHPSTLSLAKRALDILGALVGLALTAVILIPLAVAMFLDDRGPIFYSQVRCGLHGKPFRIWKFRSMVVQAEALRHLVSNEAKVGIFKNRHDPRITKVGRFLRRTSLDEFPQFWNVLKGDMSLVGTRPPLVSEVVTYQRHHWQRLNVRPGITGEWQVSGRSSVLDFEEVVRMDVNYQHHWSFGYDVQIIWRTIGAVLSSRGAC